MKETSFAVYIHGNLYHFTYKYFEDSVYGPMAEIKMEGQRMYVDENLTPFMIHMPYDWIGPALSVLRQILAKPCHV